MAADLLPCAWCGAAAMTERPHPGCSMVYCSNIDCPVHAGTGWCDESEEAADVRWNRRAPPIAAPAPSAMATGEDERMGARPSWEVMHAPMGPAGGGSWDDARRRWAAEAPARPTPPAAPAAVTAYEIESTDAHDPITVQRTHRVRAHRWAVRRGSWCLDIDGEWVLEPLPSSRDDAYYVQHRWTTAEAAITAALAAAASAATKGE